MVFLRDEYGNIANALYRVHMHFRTKFSEERGISMGDPGWVDMLVDSRQLEAIVQSDWDAAIQERFSAPSQLP